MKPKPPDLRTSPAVIADRWGELRRHTDARIALGRAGASLPTEALLRFDLAHAQARDAVHAALDLPTLAATLAAEGWHATRVRSRAENRAAYLVRPDWGRSLHATSADSLRRAGSKASGIIVLGDGLSATAVQTHAPPLLHALRTLLPDIAAAALFVAEQARVALADEIGGLLEGEWSLMLIGERPGLSAPDSLGAYLTYAPRPGRVDAERNCVSNIRPQGLGYAEAARQIAALIVALRSAHVSGVALADIEKQRLR